MKKAILAALVVAMLSSVCHAQDVPKGDVAVGYSLLFLPKGFTLTLNGGSTAVALNVNRWLGVVGDFGVYGASSGIPGLVGETYMVGPRFSYRKMSRLTPFAQGLLGGAHANNTSGGFPVRDQALVFGVSVGRVPCLEQAGG